MEEAAQTLRADRWRTFTDVSLPLMRPGPRQRVPDRLHRDRSPTSATRSCSAATSACCRPRSSSRSSARSSTRAARRRSASCCWLRARRVLRCSAACSGARSTRRSSGKGDAGPADAAARRRAARCATASRCRGRRSPSSIYAMALVGGFVETWGRDYTPTLRHYVKAFGVEWGAARHASGPAPPGTRSGRRSSSSAIAAPLTAALGILTAYLLTRQKFAGQARVRVRHDAVVRHSRHGDRRRRTSSPSTCRRSRSPAPR